ncbi:5131_t:CDS:1, partial [Cetraspora pellucida]
MEGIEKKSKVERPQEIVTKKRRQEEENQAEDPRPYESAELIKNIMHIEGKNQFDRETINQIP